MAQSLASVPGVSEAGGLREWGPPAYATEIASIETWSWRPVAPTSLERQAQINPKAATIANVLAAWRAAERRLQHLLEASPMTSLVRSDVIRLRAEYHRLFGRALRKRP